MAKKLIISLKIALFLCVISLSACGKITDKQKGPVGKGPVGKDSTYTLNSEQTIIDADDNMEWIFGKNYSKWTPSEADIGNAEKLITQCFNDQKRGTVNRLLNRKPGDYYKQFVGAINEKGEKIIWVNGFCKDQISSFKSWKTKLIIVKDGGNCFFNLKINVDKNDYYDVVVNGDA